jgi:hypothetical protein
MSIARLLFGVDGQQHAIAEDCFKAFDCVPYTIEQI